MSRAFAHEYLQHKAKEPVKIMEVNVASNIQKMFEVVNAQKTKQN